MRIIIDIQGAQSAGSRNRGIGRYSEDLAEFICKNKQQHEIHLILNAKFDNCIDEISAKFLPLIPKTNIHIFNPFFPHEPNDPDNKSYLSFNEAMYTAFVNQLEGDVLLVTSLFEWYETIISVKKYLTIPTAVVLYDLIPYINEKIYLENINLRTWYFEVLDNLKRADLLLSISQSSGNEAIDWLGFEPKDVVNISTACGSHFKQIAITNEDYTHLQKQYDLTQPYIMYTGGIDYRKNIEGLIRAYALLPKNIIQATQLAIVCSIKPIDIERLSKLVKEVGLKADRVIFTGFVPEKDLVILYNACKLFVFPSWHEGFGLPALEAMHCGVPVIASNNSSLPEVVGLEEALFDPRSDKAIATKMQQALTDERFREKLIKHGLIQAQRFDWNIIAQTAIKSLEKLVKEKQSLSTPLAYYRPKMAYISPLLPEQSGISVYSGELLAELTRWYDITVIVRDVEVTDTWVKTNTVVKSVDWFIQHSNEFERIVYHFGNSEFHAHMFELISSIPGILVLHDFFLSGVQAYRSVVGDNPNTWVQNLYHSHGYPALYLSENETYEYEARWVYPTNLKVLQDALGTIIHSEYSKVLADKWYGKNTSKDWRLIPHLRVLPPVNDKILAREHLNLPKDAFIICSYGIIGETKRTLDLINAFIASNLINKNCYLILVGQMPETDYGKQIQKILANSAASKYIKVTGWTGNEEFKDYLQVADVAVQLRSLSRGETSGTVLDSMNYGLATLVNANGSMAYLDQNSVYMIPDEFTQAELTQALQKLYSDPNLRMNLGKNATQTIKQQHNPRKCGELYFEAIEHIYQKQQTQLFGILNNKFHNKSIKLNYDNHAQLQALAKNFQPTIGLKQIFVDVTAYISNDNLSNSYQLFLNTLESIVVQQHNEYRIEPVYILPGEIHFRYARKFTCDLIGVKSGDKLEDTFIEYKENDIYLGLDSIHENFYLEKDSLQILKNSGVLIEFFLLDLSLFNISDNIQLAESIISILSAMTDKILVESEKNLSILVYLLDNFGMKNRFTPILLQTLNKQNPEKILPNKNNVSYLNDFISALVDNSSLPLNWLPSSKIVLWGADSRMLSQMGKKVEKNIITQKTQGYFIFGPYIPLIAGKYIIKILGRSNKLSGTEYIELAHNQGNTLLVSPYNFSQLPNKTNNFDIIIPFKIDEDILDFEIRIWVDNESDFLVSEIFIEPIN